MGSSTIIISATQGVPGPTGPQGPQGLSGHGEQYELGAKAGRWQHLVWHHQRGYSLPAAYGSSVVGAA